MSSSFHDVSDAPKMTLADAPLAKECDPNRAIQMTALYERSLVVICESIKNCPCEHGEWTGKRGDSKWVPDPYYTPQKQNSDGLTWKEILQKYKIDGINFKDGEPDFSEISKGTVQIEPFSTDRDDNFDKADMALAKQRGCSPEEVRKWRKENGYTWHECKDMKTMQKVPSVVHNNVSHRGGISEAKNAGG